MSIHIHVHVYWTQKRNVENIKCLVWSNHPVHVGMFLVVHWQDADSSSANEVTRYFPQCNVMLCSGHYVGVPSS